MANNKPSIHLDSIMFPYNGIDYIIEVNQENSLLKATGYCNKKVFTLTVCKDFMEATTSAMETDKSSYDDIVEAVKVLIEKEVEKQGK